MGFVSMLGSAAGRIFGGHKELRQADELPDKKPKALYLVAEPGYPNYGDELIAREWLRYLAQRCPGREVIMDCARPGPAAMVLRGTHPHAEFTDTLRRLGTENPFPYDGPINDISGFVAAALDDEGKAAQYAAGIRVLQHDVQSIHLLGGGYMRGDWTCNLSRLVIGPWASKRGIPVMGTGIGLMPIEGDSLAFARSAISDFDGFTVRDACTLELLNGGGTAEGIASLAPDDCFINGLEGCYADSDGLPDVMLCIQSDFIEDPEALHRHIEDVLIHWGVTRHDHIGVAECNPIIDRPIFDYLIGQGYDSVRFFPVAEILENGFPARPGQRWLSTRYHPHLLASAIGCEGSFIVVDQRYYSVKHDAVLHMGSRWTMASVDGIIPMPGQGFEDNQARFRFRDRIRKTVEPLYG